jgi:hypothetical protein
MNALQYYHPITCIYNPNWKPFLSKILFIFFQKNEPLPVQKTPHLGNGPLKQKGIISTTSSHALFVIPVGVVWLVVDDVY